MSSFHRGDWFSVAQTITSITAILGAYGIVFVQDRFDRKREESAEARQLLRERYRSSIYVHAVLGNAMDAAAEIVEGVAELERDGNPYMETVALETARLDESSAALAQALHQPLPTEIIESVHSAWVASQRLARAAHRTAHAGRMRIATLLAYCREQQGILEDAMRSVRASRDKWQADLAREGSVLNRRRDAEQDR